MFFGPRRPRRCAFPSLFLVLAGLLLSQAWSAAPQILTPPQAAEISFRESAALTVQTDGDGVTLQWYTGASGDLSAPVPGATGAFLLSQPLMSSTSFWVRASNAEGYVDSPAASVTVRPPLAGALKGMGANYYSMLSGLSDKTMPGFIMSGATAVSAGIRHNLVIREDASLWGLGDNGFYQFGVDPPYSQQDPRPLTTGVVHAAAGGYFSLYIKSDGSLWGMGRNASGQMGDGSQVERSRPYQIASTVADAAAGEEHSAWVTTDGILWATGSNHSGQLGDSSTTQRLSPVQVATGVARIYTGNYHTLFIKTDGSLWGTGYNAGGQLGDGSEVDRTTPFKIADGVVSAAGGHGHSLFLTAGNTMRGMGRNFFGQLGLPGIGATGNRLIPETIAEDVTHVACGGYHSLYISTDHVLHTMGSGQHGKLGDGTPFDRADPHSAGLAIATDGSEYHSIFIDASPVISSQPQNAIIVSGKTATFSVMAEGAEPYTYQWYRGQSGDTSQPLLGAFGSQFITPALRKDSTYWVRVSNPWGYTDSAAAQAFVTTKPKVKSLVRKVKVPHLATAVLTSEVSGSQLSYQWYQGRKGDTSRPVSGANGKMLVTPPLTDSATFWLRATNAAGEIDSAAVAVTVAAPIEGRLLGTGHNQGGQLATGNRTGILSYREIATGVTRAFKGNDRTFFVKADGSFWGVGENSNGELGDGTNIDRLQPVQLPTSYVMASERYFLDRDGGLWYATRTSVTKIGDGFASVDATTHFVIALKTDGTLWGKGTNSRGLLGQGDLTDRAEFVKIDDNVVKAAAGNTHTLYLKKDGSLWGTGSSEYGQIGVWNPFHYFPSKLFDSGIADIAVGGDHSLFLKNDGSLWGLGLDSNGQLGDGIGATSTTTPVAIATGVIRIDGGRDYSAFLKSNHELWAMGRNSHGELGDGTTTDRHQPVLSATGVVDFTTSNFHLLVVDGRPANLMVPQLTVVAKGKRGEVTAIATSSTPVTWQWYRGESGDTSTPISGAKKNSYRTPAVNESYTVWARATNQYGFTDTPATLIQMVTLPAISAIPGSTSVRYGDAAVLPVTASGGVLTYTWYEGAPGDISKPLASIDQPVMITRPLRAAATCWVRVSNVAGAVDSAAVPLAVLPREGTHLTTAGRNQYGQLGNGLTERSPVRIPVASRVVQAAGGVYNTYFLKDDGTLWGMGYNNVGQLGKPTTTTEPLPIQIATDVAEVVAGNLYILFIKADGSLWGLGYNNHGQLGQGDLISRNIPVPIATGVVQAAAGEAHSIFVKSDGSAWAMGRDTDGEQGNGASITGDVLVPAQIATGVADVAAGEHHTVLLKSDGTLWAAGWNNHLQLGDGTTTSRASFVPVGTGFRAVTCGHTHTLVQKTDDSLWTLAKPLSLIATGVESMAAGVNYSMFVTREGQLYGLGSNENGQLGDGSLAPRYTPALLGKAHAVACGDYHSAVLDGRPVIVTQPAAAIVQPGQVAELSVGAIGSGPITYQWYRGESGDERLPLVGAVAATYRTGPLDASTSYWVRVGNSYGHESSLAATMTVGSSAVAAARAGAQPERSTDPASALNPLLTSRAISTNASVVNPGYAAFDTADVDDSGGLTLPEFATMLAEGAKAANAFNRVDRDHSGLVALDEYLIFVGRIEGPTKEGLSFVAADVNESGEIDLEEFGEAITGRLAKIEVFKRFLHADADADDALSVEEWTLYMNGEAKGPDGATYNKFDLADVDEDGQLTIDEFALAFPQGTKDATIATKFAKEDQDDSGFLTRSEWNPGTSKAPL